MQYLGPEFDILALLLRAQIEIVPKLASEICIGLFFQALFEISTLAQSYRYIPSTLNIVLILWHTQWIVCAVKC